jgi:hypothetical protein
MKKYVIYISIMFFFSISNKVFSQCQGWTDEYSNSSLKIESKFCEENQTDYARVHLRVKNKLAKDLSVKFLFKWKNPNGYIVKSISISSYPNPEDYDELGPYYVPDELKNTTFSYSVEVTDYHTY